jgi:hypothetical protein
MSVLFDILYREYCRARLAEMRKQLLLTDSHEAPEANCADGAADRAGDSVSALRLISGASVPSKKGPSTDNSGRRVTGV